MGIIGARHCIAALAALSVVCAAGTAGASDFYQGKTVTLVVGGNPGGVYDIVGRALARHMPKHIAGNPKIVVQNMPGAGSNKATEWLYTSASKDGTTFAAVFPGAIVGPLLDTRRKFRFDPMKFGYIGSADSGARICITFHTSKIKTFEDAQKMEAAIGASARGGSTYDYAYALRNLAGAKFKVVAGYKGTPDLKVALESGEIDGMCGYSLAALRAEKLEWFTNRKINILLYFGHEPDRELEAMKVPEAGKYLKGDGKKAVELIVAQQAFARPYIAPPGVPADRLAILRKAFDAALADPSLKKEFAKTGSPLVPLSGEAVEKLVRKMYSAPRNIIEIARKAQKP